MPTDPHHLDRFVSAQATVWDEVQQELEAGRKTSHWMWFIFPQLAALGRSSTAKFYGIAGADEAAAYFAHPVLGPRLVHCARLLLRHKDRSPQSILGSVDALKLRSCLTLFAHVASHEPVFRECLEVFYADEEDPITLQELAQ